MDKYIMERRARMRLAWFKLKIRLLNIDSLDNRQL
jgi:hypothetical protein